jgi:4,5-DOPA dioxygenase extradiol
VLPAIFVSHGAPTLIGEAVPARDFLAALGRSLPRPKAILAVSAHWETEAPSAATTARPETIHDFHGFPEDLYSLRYPAPGAPEAALRVVELLCAAGFSAASDSGRGLDHGAWVPLLLAYPNADVPVAQLSIQPDLGPAHHLAMGRALTPLLGEGVLVFGSGGAVHNLSELNWGRHGDPPAWARAFDDWLAATLAAGDSAQLPVVIGLQPGETGLVLADEADQGRQQVPFGVAALLRPLHEHPGQQPFAQGLAGVVIQIAAHHHRPPLGGGQDVPEFSL